METLVALGAGALRSTIITFRDHLAAHVAFLDRLNVYPVPDGDTGTNMAGTLDAVVRELGAAAPEMKASCEAIRHGSLMGARGNSGVILSQILGGLAGACRDHAEATPQVLAEGLRDGIAAAYRAVERPVEGTILTVGRESAEAAALAAASGGTLLDTLEVGRRAGQVALARTPELLPVLAEAGVVDAGGAGLLLLFDAALHVVGGVALPAGPPLPDPQPSAPGRSPRATDPRYEVTYLLDLPDHRIDEFRAAWAGLGDSVVVVGGGGVWSCHIHTNDIDAALGAAIDAHGRPRALRVTDLHRQVEDRHAAVEGQRSPDPFDVT